jgi:hypothetical protein
MNRTYDVMAEQSAVLEAPAVTALPLAYGYMRVPCDVPDEKVRQLEKEVISYAEAQGFHLDRFFFEFACGSREAFDELTDELVRSDVHHVVVPSFRHLAHNELLQDLMMEQLSLSASADVLAMRLRTAIE